MFFARYFHREFWVFLELFFAIMIKCLLIFRDFLKKSLQLKSAKKSGFLEKNEGEVEN